MTRTPVLLSSVGLWLAILGTTVPAAAQSPEQAAQQAAESWLALVDSARYAGSWTEAAPAFRAAVSQGVWDSTLIRVRRPLGAVSSRELLRAQYTTSLPNAPPGGYVVLPFRTGFASRETSAVETVGPMKLSAGTWRVSGCFGR